MNTAESILLATAGLLAGIMDGAMGGGGLIQVPALQWIFPNYSWMHIFAINKMMSVSGTGVALYQYASHANSPLVKKHLCWTFPLALLASAAGASTIGAIDKTVMRWVVIALLVSVALYIFFRPKIGDHAASEEAVRKIAYWKWAALSAGVAAYDGFFGPGTGAFALFGGVVLLHLSFLQSQAVAKSWNFASNLGALSFFAFQGFWYPQFMGFAVANMLGNWLGAKVVLKYGNKLLRKLFLGIVSVLIARMLYQALALHF